MQGNRIMTGLERRFMVYGIGNGLVDKQVKITDSELEDLRLSKGFMELADQAEQAREPVKLVQIGFLAQSNDDLIYHVGTIVWGEKEKSWG